MTTKKAALPAGTEGRRQSRGKITPSSPFLRGDYTMYESKKATLSRMGLSPIEYQNAIKALAEKVGV